MTVVTLNRGAITVTDAPGILKERLTYWKRELTYDKKRRMRTVAGHYENLFSEEGNVLTTLPGFGHRILETLRKSGTPFSIVDSRLPLPTPDYEKACNGLRDYQLEPVIQSVMSGGGILSAATGFGKALPDDSFVPTPLGWRMVKEIKVGDELFGRNGQPVKVLGVHPQPKKLPIWEVVLRDGRVVQCCEKHQWTWAYSYESNKTRTGSTKELLADVKRLGSTKNGRKRRFARLPICEPVQYKHIDLPVDPYVLGAAIGNGCFSEKHFLISSGDDYVPSKVAEILGCVAQRSCLKNYSYAFRRKKAVVNERTKRSRILLQFDEVIGDFYPCFKSRPSRHKFIPDEYLTSSIEQRIALLQGLLDTDGTADRKGRISYTTTSAGLAEDLMELINSLGGTATICVDTRKGKYRGGKAYDVKISLRPEMRELAFTHPSKHERVMHAMATRKVYPNEFIRVVAVRKTNKKAPMTCFTVDAKDSLFLAEEYVVTHNTVMTSAIIRAYDPEALKLRGTPTVVFAAPDKDINRKNYEELKRFLPDREVGLVMSGVKKFSDDVQVITLDSLHLLNPDEVGLLIVDEVHSAASTSRAEAISRFHKAARWGVSATPGGRFDGGDLLLEGLFGPVVCRRTYQDAVRLGALVPIEVYWLKAPPPPSLATYKAYKNRDYKIKAALTNNKEYSKLVADLIRAIPDSRSVLCFTQWIAQMANIHAYCPEVGYVHAQTSEGVGSIAPISPKQRKEIYSRMKDGEIRKILATHCWKQGVDFEGLDIVINASGGGSDISSKQIPGRASRKADGKDKAYMVDFIHEWDWDESGTKRKPGPLLSSDYSRRKSYKELGFEQHFVDSINDLPFIKERT